MEAELVILPLFLPNLLHLLSLILPFTCAFTALIDITIILDNNNAVLLYILCILPHTLADLDGNKNADRPNAEAGLERLAEQVKLGNIRSTLIINSREESAEVTLNSGVWRCDDDDSNYRAI